MIARGIESIQLLNFSTFRTFRLVSISDLVATVKKTDARFPRGITSVVDFLEISTHPFSNMPRYQKLLGPSDLKASKMEKIGNRE